MLKILQQRQQEWQLNKAMECHSKRWSGPLVSVCGTRTGTANATTVNKADEKGRVGGADADKIDCHGDSWFTEAPAKECQKLHFNCCAWRAQSLKNFKVGKLRTANWLEVLYGVIDSGYIVLIYIYI